MGVCYHQCRDRGRATQAMLRATPAGRPRLVMVRGGELKKNNQFKRITGSDDLITVDADHTAYRKYQTCA